MNDIKQFLSSTDLHTEVKRQIEEMGSFSNLSDCNSPQPEIAIIAAARYDYSSGGGVARYSQLHVFYLDTKQFKEWQYADKWSSRNDCRNLMINEIAGVKVDEVDEKLSITVECVPAPSYSNWFAKFSFPKKESVQTTTLELSSGEQEEFKRWVNEECDKIHNQHLENWKNNSHTQPSAHGRLPYRCPRRKDLKVNHMAGLAVFVTEEQIDFRGMDNAQMQQKAFLLDWNKKTIKEIYEVHAYEQSGSSNLDIISVGSKDVMLGTPDGPVTIKV